MESITSRQNSRLKSHAKLLSSASKRREEGLYICEGARLCCDAALSKAEIEVCYVTENALEKYRSYAEPVMKLAKESFLLSDSAAEVLSSTKSSQGVYCVCRMPSENRNIPKGRKLLALENIQDPSNMGTILRTAEAVGIDGVLLSEDCCDIYSPKVLRGSMGAVFRMPAVICGNLTNELKKLGDKGYTTMAAVVTDAVKITQVDFSSPSVIVIGNEGNGLTDETAEACSMRVTIPMLGRAESLNASAAAAILMWEMMRGESLGG